MKYGIIGASGKMGKEIRGVFDEAGCKCVYTYDIEGETQSDVPEVIIDFSLPVVFPKTMEIIKKFKSALIMGTTGLQAEQLAQLQELSNDTAVVQSFNYSVGIQLLLQCIEKVKGQIED